MVLGVLGSKAEAGARAFASRENRRADANPGVKQRPHGIIRKKLPISDISDQHLVACVACLLSDLEHRDSGVRGGPHDGRWFWTVQIGPGRVPFNSGAGNADGGREARETCEVILLRMGDA
jgi:hypothetical protein